jgi:FixJ family two-component response regulator
MDSLEQVVFVVDGDPEMCRAVATLCRTPSSRVIAFGCAADYIFAKKADVPGCVVLALDLPDANGLDLQDRISKSVHPPIVFVSDRCDVPASVRAIKAGAVDFLTKPVDQRKLSTAVDAAIRQDRATRVARMQLEALRHRYRLLSPRERQVLPLVVGGRLNKQSAAELGISETTLQIHRRNVMHKMEAGSLADLVRMASALDVPLPLARSVYRARFAPDYGRNAVRAVANDQYLLHA